MTSEARTPEHDVTSLIDVRDLTVAFPTLSGRVLAANRVSFDVKPGETLGLVGESGCGKSVTLRSLVGLVPQPGAAVDGTITWKGDTFDATDRGRVASLRGRSAGMIFQDPTASLDPVYSIGAQLVETLTRVRRLRLRDARRRALELLERVGIPAPDTRLRDYPHQLSGGMRQRVMIALALATDPALLLADEPTTALDVTIQLQILELLRDVQADTGMAIILVSHDLGVVAHACHRVAVMYAGSIVELGATDHVLRRTRHPYTAALLRSVPDLGPRTEGSLDSIPGQPPSLEDLPPGCPFAPRCGFRQDRCGSVPVILDRPTGEHGSACPVVSIAQLQSVASP